MIRTAIMITEDMDRQKVHSDPNTCRVEAKARIEGYARPCKPRNP